MMLFSPFLFEILPERAMHFSGTITSMQVLKREGNTTASIESVKSEILIKAIRSLFFVTTCLTVSIIPAIVTGIPLPRSSFIFLIYHVGGLVDVLKCKVPVILFPKVIFLLEWPPLRSVI